ncbi:phosphotransferase family protein [Candidatus Binatia bacterium]|nr:phosphotransferase family protein [Candidatus Binatia bacterium]
MRQARWRPAWDLDVERDGAIVPIYFRGDRTEGSGVYGLEHEYGVLHVLAANGIPVPRVYGFCHDPRGIVMERAPGRANLATARDDDERRAVLDHYIELLVAMQRIDVGEFEALGFHRPTTAAELALADLPRWEQSFRARKRRPEPLIELVLRWLHAHLPEKRTRACFATGDAGQFLFEDGRVTAVIDLELAFLGDPLADLGAMRSRDASEPLGDLSRAYRRYADLTGEPIDMGTLHFHTVRFALNTPLAVAPLCADPPPGFNLAQYLSWYLVYGRLPLEVIAEVEGIPLDPPPTSITADVSTAASAVPASRFGVAHDVLVGLLEGGERSYATDTALRVARYVREIDRHGARVAAQDADELASLLGRRSDDPREADAALEARIADAGRDETAAIVRYLHRRTLRHEVLLRPAMRELADARFQMIRP